MGKQSAFRELPLCEYVKEAQGKKGEIGQQASTNLDSKGAGAKLVGSSLPSWRPGEMAEWKGREKIKAEKREMAVRGFWLKGPKADLRALLALSLTISHLDLSLNLRFDHGCVLSVDMEDSRFSVQNWAGKHLETGAVGKGI